MKNYILRQNWGQIRFDYKPAEMELMVMGWRHEKMGENVAPGY